MNKISDSDSYTVASPLCVIWIVINQKGLFHVSLRGGTVAQFNFLYFTGGDEMLCVVLEE
jgi:hypothetical protein